MLRSLYWLSVAVVAVPTLLGLLAPFDPRLEMPNHFRVYLLLGAMTAVVLGAFARPRALPWVAASVLTVNLILTAVPFGYSAPSAPAPDGEAFKLVSFNLWASARHEEIAAFIETAAPDVVFLQEVRPTHLDKLLPRLRTAYSHQAICAACGLAVLSKAPLTSIDTSGGLPMVTAVWTSPRGQAYRIASVHSPWPFAPEAQERSTDDLIAAVRGWSEPLILAGDFNLTPWSWKLNKLLARTGLKRHGTFAASWPVFAQFKPASAISRWPLPSLLLIDNVLTSPGISAGGFESGPDLGSDHRPITARMTLP